MDNMCSTTTTMTAQTIISLSDRIYWSRFFFVSSVCRARAHTHKKTDQIGELAGAILFLCTHKLIKGKRLTANETCFRLIYIFSFFPLLLILLHIGASTHAHRIIIVITRRKSGGQQCAKICQFMMAEDDWIVLLRSSHHSVYTREIYLMLCWWWLLFERSQI